MARGSERTGEGAPRWTCSGPSVGEARRVEIGCSLPASSFPGLESRSASAEGALMLLNGWDRDRDRSDGRYFRCRAIASCRSVFAFVLSELSRALSDARARRVELLRATRTLRAKARAAADAVAPSQTARDFATNEPIAMFGVAITCKSAPTLRTASRSEQRPQARTRRDQAIAPACSTTRA